jgi:hypothetical protein
MEDHKIVAQALASRTNGAADRTNVAQASQLSSVRRAGVTFAGTNALWRAASIISQDPLFLAGTQAAAEKVLRESEEGNARIVPRATDWEPYIVSDSNEGSFTGEWTVVALLRACA